MKLPGRFAAAAAAQPAPYPMQAVVAAFDDVAAFLLLFIACFAALGIALRWARLELGFQSGVRRDRPRRRSTW